VGKQKYSDSGHGLINVEDEFKLRQETRIFIRWLFRILSIIIVE